MGFSSFSIWLCYESIMYYLRFPIVTEIKTHIERKASFPAVTICNIDPLLTQTASNYIEKHLPLGFNMSLFEGMTSNNETYNTLSKLDEVRSYILNAANDPLFGDNEKKKLGYSLGKFSFYFICIFLI